MMKKSVVLFFLFLYSVVSAQVKFEAQTDRDTYGLNERFPIAFSINNEGDNFQGPKFPGFKAEGPFINKGNQTSITIINGKMTQKREITTQVIYYLTPTKKGTFTIGSASIEYNGTLYKTVPIKITITDPIQMPSYPGQNPRQQQNYNFGEGIHLVGELSTKSAYVNEFTDRFDDGLDTVIGERGVKLSGGQRQRITIARAILANPNIFILDEATSNLDTESESLIQSSLSELIKDRTTFVIAHRLSTIRQADQILVIENGHIAEQGNHDELIAKQGRYYELFTYQSRI